MSTTSRPRVTLVSAVHDDAARLAPFIAGVEALDLSAAEVQVVMVDGGSSDDSLAQLRAWASRSPQLVSVVALQDATVGAARNAGLAQARGEWVSFPRPCDSFDADYLTRVATFADEHPEAVLVATNRQIADQGGANVTNTHPLRMFHRGDRVLELDRLPEIIVGDPTSTFFRTDEVHRHDVVFDDLRSAAPEPFAFAWRLMLRSGNTHAGLMRTARYRQRRGVLIGGRPASLAAGDQEPTLEMLRRSYLAVLDESGACGGPEWLQHQMVYGLAHFFNTNDSRPPVGVPVDAGDRESFHELVGSILARLDVDDVIPYSMGRIRRLARYVLQFGYRSDAWVEPFVLMDHLDDEQRLVRLSYHYTGEPPEEEFRSNGERVAPVHAKTRTLWFTGRHLLSQRVAWVPFHGLMEARLGGRPADLEFEYPAFPRRRTTQGIAGWFLRPDTSRVLDPARRATPPVAHTREGRKAQRLAGRARYRRKYADAWVLMDRLHDASDNAEAMFKHLRRDEPGINAWFVLEEASPHWERLVREGYQDRMVAHGSTEWRVLMLHCRHLLSSHADLAVTAPQEIKEIRHLDWRFTFLQHGVIMFDLSNWLNAKRLDTLVTSTAGEFHSIAGDQSQYTVTTREVALTGMPRWDRLLEMSRGYQGSARDLILVAPTWRKWLLPPIVPGSQKRPLDLSALESDFFRSWKAFLTDQRLADLAGEHGLSVGFLPHPNLQPLLGHLGLPEHVQPLTYADHDVQELISRARLMVTDYSSVAFDAAYTNRPVCYFQFDTEQMLEGSHVGSRGYFEFERDGFGPVAHSVDEVVRDVRRVIEAGPDPMPEYAARMESTFLNRDGGCCARVVEAVRRSAQPADDGHVVPTPAPSRAWR